MSRSGLVGDFRTLILSVCKATCCDVPPPARPGVTRSQLYFGAFAIRGAVEIRGVGENGDMGEEIQILVDVAVRVPDDLLKKYRSVSNATVLGELSRRGYLKVYMNDVHSLVKGRRLVGRAVTLRYLPSRPDLQERVTRCCGVLVGAPENRTGVV